MEPVPTRASDRSLDEHIAHLAIADPEAARRMHNHLAGSDRSAFSHLLSQIVDEVIEALATELSFGRTLAEGMGRMLIKGTADDVQRYRSMVSAAAANGPTLAGLFAHHLVPVLTCGDTRLADRLADTVRVMIGKGTYTLKAPLETLGRLIEANDLAGAHAFIDLLNATYGLDTSYNRTVYLTHTLPRAVNGFDEPRRLWQIQALTRVIEADERLADDYLKGLASGLGLLSAAALKTFLDQAMAHYRKNAEQGACYLSLESRRAQEACRDLQVTASLSSLRGSLERYLQARTGMALAIRPLSSLPSERAQASRNMPLTHVDGQAIYLPDEMGILERQKDNVDLYKLLVKLEAGAFEFGTFDLDAQKALDGHAAGLQPDMARGHATDSQLALVINAFEHPGLALDLFTLCEHARIARRVQWCYPGLFRRLNATLNDAALLSRTGCPTGGTLFPIYQHMVMGTPLETDSNLAALGDALTRRLDHDMASGMDSAETSAQMAMAFYPALAEQVGIDRPSGYEPLSLPFGRRLDPASFAPPDSVYAGLAADIRSRLATRGIRAYQSDLHTLLRQQHGRLSITDIGPLVANPTAEATTVDLSWLDLDALACSHGLALPTIDAAGASAFCYREWDWCMGDYLPDRVRVLERDTGGLDETFYEQTLNDFNGLVKRIRYAFELLRPEELTILRQWREGDAFDYRALLDYAMDRKAGLIPSDRLFIKRMKRVRDVAALLLVDLSRSTANTVDQQGTRVLDVEKQAIVLLGEALNVVGDRFAIAGFSGTGPLGVDYYRIKDLDAPFDDEVKARIGAMAPQRSTRMGAAIRHATAQLETVTARVRLIMILGDGYPNDLAYKGPYAVEDTRRAVMEARTAAIHVKAITVNVSDNGQLDRLYGRSHHTLIGNVRDLPDRLVRVYSTLTRH
jgi:hypothetical protein